MPIQFDLGIESRPRHEQPDLFGATMDPETGKPVYQTTSVPVSSDTRHNVVCASHNGAATS